VGATAKERAMGHRVRWYVTEVVHEVTIRTLGGAFWLRPDAACKAIIEGVFGKALRLYPGIRLYGYDAQSNHLHYLFGALDPAETPLFLDYVHSNIARQLNQLRKREGVFWSRRGAVIAVLDGAAQIERLRYLLAQGPKSKLVASPKDWPGACSTPALLGDMTVRASYRSLDRVRRNAQRAQPRPEAELAEDVAFTLTPLPVWADLDADARRAKVAALIADIEVEYARLGAGRRGADQPGPGRDAGEAAGALADPGLPRRQRARPPALPRGLRRVPRPLQAGRRPPARGRAPRRGRDPPAVPGRRPGPPALVRPGARQPRRHLAPRPRRRRPGPGLRAGPHDHALTRHLTSPPASATRPARSHPWPVGSRCFRRGTGR
jgi:hypothetical protein